MGVKGSYLTFLNLSFFNGKEKYGCLAQMADMQYEVFSAGLYSNSHLLSRKKAQIGK